MPRTLADTLEPFFGTQPPVRCYGYFVLVRSLYQLLSIAGRSSPKERKTQFLHGLSLPEKRVVYLLGEWWAGWFQESSITRLTKAALFAFAMQELSFCYNRPHEKSEFELLLNQEFDMGVYQTIKTKLFETHQGVHQCGRLTGHVIFDDPTMAGTTLYNRILFRLAIAELVPETCSEMCSEESLMQLRTKAAGLAACQRVANGCVRHGLALIRTIRNSEEKGKRAGRHLHRVMDPEPLRDPRWPDDIRDRDVGHSLWNPGAVLDSCPWLRGQPDTSNLHQPKFPGMPYYLWNIKERKTVRVADLPFKPRYAVISHSWGRWRQREEVRLDGVPWLIPANSRFQITALPVMIEKARFPEQYACIDLFCIPQNCSNDSEQQGICQSEIGRQAHIFQNAGTAVAWLWEIEDWRPTAAAVAYLAVAFHNSTDERPLYDHLLVAYAKHTADRCGLVEGAIYGEHHRDASAIGWFSSLWTLQQLLMRPDMLLLNRHWEPLVVWAVGITLDTIGTLVVHYTITFDPESPQGVSKLPPGPREIYVLFCNTGIASQLTWPSPLSALILGGNRICEHSRSQAIMSVTAATKWFTSNNLRPVSRPKPLNELIFGLYEPAFIKEVIDLVGGLFFMGRSGRCTVRLEPQPQSDKDISVHSVSCISGSIVPFCPGSAPHSINIPPEKRRRLEDHPSVSGWRIAVGKGVTSLGYPRVHVVLPTASILASNCKWEAKSSAGSPSATATTESVSRARMRVSPRSRPRPLKAEVLCNSPEAESNKCVLVFEVDIDEWVDKFRVDTFAVCVMSSPTEVLGVLLQRTTPDPHRLVKIGVFEVQDDEIIQLPEACQVDWIVT